MTKKNARIAVSTAAVVLLAAVLTWQLWPEDKPATTREALADIPGVKSVSNSATPQVRLPPDIELAALRSSVTDLAMIIENTTTSLLVFVGDVHFRIERGEDGQRNAELAWAAATIEDLDTAQVVGGTRELVDVTLPRGASPVDATRQILGRYAAEDIEPPTGSLTASIPDGTFDAVEVRISGLTLEEAMSRHHDVTAVVESSGGELLLADLDEHDIDLRVQVPSLSDVADVRRSVLERFDPEETHLVAVVDQLSMTGLLDRSPTAAIRLVKQVEMAGATVTDIDAPLDSISITTATPKVAEKVLSLMDSSGWTLRPDGGVGLALETGEPYERSEMSADTSTLLRIGPTALDVHRAGFRVKFGRGEADDQAGRFAVSPGGYQDGAPAAVATSARGARTLIDVLRGGDWAGRMTFGIYGNSTVFTSFTSTTSGPARNVKNSPNTPADQQDVADDLERFVKRWNDSAS